MPQGLEPVSSCSTRTAGGRGSCTETQVKLSARFISLHRVEVKHRFSTKLHFICKKGKEERAVVHRRLLDLTN